MHKLIGNNINYVNTTSIIDLRLNSLFKLARKAAFAKNTRPNFDFFAICGISFTAEGAEGPRKWSVRCPSLNSLLGSRTGADPQRYLEGRKHLKCMFEQN